MIGRIESAVDHPVVFSFGDPNGVGPEVFLKALHSLQSKCSLKAIVFGNGTYLDSLAHDLDISLKPNLLSVITVGDYPYPPRWGRISESSGAFALESLRQAVLYCKERGHPLLVTPPVSKQALTLSGFQYPGQTEYVASFFEESEAAMAFLSDRFHLMLATIHIPLRDVFSRLTAELLESRCRLFYETLLHLGLECPRIAVCGLNPHASESGLLGTEEENLITPVISRLRSTGLSSLSGPYPPDTIFWRADRKEFDGVVALYHDQGLIPLKLVAFASAVNTTVGLPIVRTSPDHGTAFDLAGRGLADPGSMLSAIRWGIRLVAGRSDQASDITPQ